MTPSRDKRLPNGRGGPCLAAGSDYDCIMSWCRKQRQQRAVEEVVGWAFSKWRQLSQENGLRSTLDSGSAARGRDVPWIDAPIDFGPGYREPECPAESEEQGMWKQERKDEEDIDCR